jgi:ring-1,2-phenylacetyl-CoA epoxidase subunit PaaD
VPEIQAREARVWQVLCAVPDPEIPIVSIVDLGIVRYVHWQESGPRIGLTPTYVGCPATDAIRTAVQQALEGAGYADAVIEEVLSPPWTSDWLTPAAHAKLAAFGIAPPDPVEREAQGPSCAVRCPRCASDQTRLLSEFGSTPCKAHYRCEACLEPFDRFKCI